MTNIIANRQKLTFEEYLELPYDGRQVELIGGELLELTPPRQRHNRIQKRLYDALRDYAQQFNPDWEPYPAGPGVQASQDDSYIPDLVIAASTQWEALEAQDTAAVFRLGNPPLLVVEIVSPSSKRKDTRDLLVEYAHCAIIRQNKQPPNHFRKVNAVTLRDSA